MKSTSCLCHLDFKFSQWKSVKIAWLMLIYCMTYIKTELFFSLTWALKPPISLGSHKLLSLYWAEWSYCSAVSNLGVSLPTCAGASLRILMNYTAQSKHASRALNLEDRLWGFLRETPSPIPEWWCERNHPQITRLRFNEVFRLQQAVAKIFILV